MPLLIKNNHLNKLCWLVCMWFSSSLGHMEALFLFFFVINNIFNTRMKMKKEKERQRSGEKVSWICPWHWNYIFMTIKSLYISKFRYYMHNTHSLNYIHNKWLVAPIDYEIALEISFRMIVEKDWVRDVAIYSGKKRIEQQSHPQQNKNIWRSKNYSTLQILHLKNSQLSLFCSL